MITSLNTEYILGKEYIHYRALRYPTPMSHRGTLLDQMLILGKEESAEYELVFNGR